VVVAFFRQQTIFFWSVTFQCYLVLYSTMASIWFGLPFKYFISFCSIWSFSRWF